MPIWVRKIHSHFWQEIGKTQINRKNLVANNDNHNHRNKQTNKIKHKKKQKNSKATTLNCRYGTGFEQQNYDNRTFMKCIKTLDKMS